MVFLMSLTARTASMCCLAFQRGGESTCHNTKLSRSEVGGPSQARVTLGGGKDVF